VTPAEKARDPDEDLGALVGRKRLPERCLRRVDCTPGLGRAGLGDPADDIARERRPDLDPVARLDPFAAHEQLPFGRRRGHVESIRDGC
jgi:hypothetical protein